MILTSFNLTVFFLLLANSVLSTFLYYYIITAIFRVKNKGIIWITSSIFFILYALARTYTFLMLFGPEETFWETFSWVLHVMPEAGGLLLIFVVLRTIAKKIKGRMSQRRG